MPTNLGCCEWVAVVVSSLPYKCPGVPHEAAMLIADLFRRRGLGDKVAVDLYTPEPQPIPVAGPQLGEAVKQMLSSKRIGFYPQHKLALVDPGRQELQFEGKAPVHYEMLVAIPPHRAPAVAREGPVSPLETSSPSRLHISNCEMWGRRGMWDPKSTVLRWVLN